MVDEDEEEEYCAKCGDLEYDDDGNETHADENEYDHDFVYEEEDNGLTLDDVKNVADTVKSIAEAGEAVKKFTKTETSRPSIWEEAGRDPNRTVDKKQEKRHRDTIKWTKIGIIVAIVLALIFGVPSLIK